MIKNKKKILSVLFALTLSTNVYFKVHASEPVRTRICGRNRYETSAKVAQEGWNSSYYAIIASGENFPDSLSAVTLARKYDAPILLTNKNYLNKDTEKELLRMRIRKVFIIGGVGAVSYPVENAIKDIGISTERIWGRDRYTTSIKIAEKIGNPNSLFVVTDSNYVDALSIGPVAAKKGYPIILTSRDYLSDSVKNYLKKKKFNKIYIVGDSSVISDNVARQFENYVEDYKTGVQRIPGNNKLNKDIHYDSYERNLNIVSKFENELNLYKNIYIASGSAFADALSVNALAAKKEAPILIVNTNDDNMLKSFISRKYSNIASINIVGGQSVMSDSYLNRITNYLEDEEVIFTDKKLDEAIRKELGIKNDNERIYKSRANTVTSLDLSNYDIEDIRGIENFENLKELNLSNNPIKDLLPIEDMTSLEELNLSHNKIHSLEPLKEIYMLKNLNLSKNDIDDIEDLKDLKRLKSLNLNGNRIDYIPEFKDFNVLYHLDLGNNSNLGGFGNLSELKSLNSLKLNNTGLSNISFLEDLKYLTELDVAYNNISDIDDIEKLKELKVLYLNDNRVRDVDPLTKLKKLEELNIWGNSIDDVEKLRNFKNLKKLTIDRSLLSEDDEDELDRIRNIQYIYDEKNTYVEDFASHNDYEDKVDKNNNQLPDREYEDEELENLRQRVTQFERIYGHTYDSYEILYNSYSDHKYPSSARELIEKEVQLKRLIENECYSYEVRNMLKVDLEKTIDRYGVIRKNHDMNEKIKILESKLKMNYTEKEKRKTRNKINYIYADYRYDFYKNATYLCERDIKELKSQIGELNFENSYTNNEKIRKLNDNLKNKNIEYAIIKENADKYSKYRDFFAVVDSLLDDNSY